MDYNGNLRGYNIWVVPPDDAYRLSLTVRAVNVFLDSISIQCHDNILYYYDKTYTIILKTIGGWFFFSVKYNIVLI